MVPFRICVLVSTSAEQFSNKTAFIKTVLETSTNLQSMFFYSAQGKGGGVCLSSLYIGQCKNVIRSQFNIVTATAN